MGTDAALRFRGASMVPWPGGLPLLGSGGMMNDELGGHLQGQRCIRKVALDPRAEMLPSPIVRLLVSVKGWCRSARAGGAMTRTSK